MRKALHSKFIGIVVIALLVLCNFSEGMTAYAATISITSQPANVTASAGDAVEFNVAATGTGLTYTWYCKKATAADFMWLAEGSKLSLTMRDDLAGMQVYCKIKDSSGSVVNSNIATLSKTTTAGDIAITKQPSNMQANVGEAVSFSVEASGTGLSYVWYCKKATAADFMWLAEGKTLNLTMRDDLAGMQVYCKIKNAAGKSVNSNTVVLTKTGASSITITKQPVNASAKAGDAVSFTTEATGTGLSYVWYCKKVTATGFMWLAEGKTLNLTMRDDLAGMQLYCKIKDSTGTTINTNTVTLTKAGSVAITKQPSNVEAKVGDAVSFTTEASGTGLSFVWYCKKTTATSFMWLAEGKTLNLTMREDLAGMQVYCKVKDSAGNTATTDTVTLTKAGAATITITKQPVNATAKAGDAVSFTAEASGAGLSYVWYCKKTSATSFMWLAQGKTLNLTMRDDLAGMQLYCKITDSKGNTATTNTVTLNKAAEAIKITTQPVNAEAKIGDAVSFTTEASGTGLSYVWYCKKASATSFMWLAEGKTLNLTMREDLADMQVYCKIKDATGSSVTTNTVKLTKAAPLVELVITKQPSSIEVKKGESAVFTAEATGAGVTYTWYCKKASAANFMWLAEGKTLSLTMRDDLDGMQVFCKVKDSYGVTKDTEKATLTLKPSYTVSLTGPTSVKAGTTSATFTATTEAPAVEWYVNGSKVSTTAKTLTYTFGSAKSVSVYAVVEGGAKTEPMTCIVLDENELPILK